MLFLFLIGIKCVIGDGQFECGEHGRFEYCIDEIPGCVIGCHCHPGYYFDTDSKICEPNIKLTQNYRRYYQTNEPTPAEIAHKEVESTEPVPTLDPIDNQVDEITKNADDLGDWLYNQFFKTIENQVINKTKENNVPTRRNGISPLEVKSISRRKMSRKKRKKSKDKRKKSSMRRKLLRITENDSVFDSTSEESESDSSESASDDSGTFEIEQGEDKHTDDKEHGHKKIVIINKKPKPPLPSFIFLPNMDTPFYPPIGLPPPPIMPMYPFVPVPPVPAFPCPDQEENGGSTTTATVTTTTSSITTNTVPSSLTTEQPLTTVSTIDEQDAETSIDIGTTEKAVSEKGVRAGRYKKKNRAARLKQRNMDEPFTKSHPLQGSSRSRSKLLQRLRHKMKNSAPIQPPIEHEENTEISFLESDGFDDTLNNEIQSKPNNNPKSENVDFKYISELIHRVNLNNSGNPMKYNPSDSVEVYSPAKYHKMKHQNFNNPKDSRSGDSDDSYYTNLGRQIASIIRNADAQNQQVNIEIEQTNQNTENHVFFNENSPKSFWERSVRSPVKFINSNKNNYDYLKRSNELLFNIENKVSIMATTEPSLNLQDIENIVNVMAKAQRKIKQNQHDLNNIRTSNKNLNFNLWPKESQHLESNLQNIQAKPVFHENEKNVFKKLPELHGVSMQNFHRFTAWLSTGKNNETYKDKTYLTETKPIERKFINTMDKQSQLPISAISTRPVALRSNSSMIPKIPIIDHQSFPSMLPNYKYMERKKYFQDNSNAGVNDGYVIPMKPVHHFLNMPFDPQPTYFHHDISHFHYF
ncbi:unnamed protein product [Colias eurytheme]|nr:unnamed protein product [Colias eurytheme]